MNITENGKFAALAIALGMASTLTGAAVTYTGANGGSWNDPANWDSGTVPGSGDDVVVAGKTVEAYGDSVSVASLTLDGATVSVGAKTDRDSATLTVAGDLTVKGGSKLTVYAGSLSDYTPFATMDADIAPLSAALWQAAKVVTVGGDFSVLDSGTVVYPDADKVTGVPVFFKVGGNFTLGEGASFNAVERGFGWTTGTTDIPGAKVNQSRNVAWTLSPQPGRDYNFGGGYGGRAASTTTVNGASYGRTYGSAMAPFLPGSCSGWYFKSSADIDVTRGGGAIVVFTTGAATVNGTMNANSNQRESSGASGGAIWLAAQSFAFGPNALLSAHGGSGSGYAGQGAGGGGRVAIAEGVSEAEITSMASGTLPAGFSSYGDIPGFVVQTDVAGGIYTGSDKMYVPEAGTLSYVRASDLPVAVKVEIDGNASVSYGGETYSSTFTKVIPVGTTATFTAAPAPGSAISCWYGGAFEGGKTVADSVTVQISQPMSMRVVCVSLEATERTWTGATSSDWDVGSNWSPAGVPGPNDSVIITSGTVSAAYGATVGSIDLRGGTLTVGTAPARTAGHLNVAGNFSVSGGATLKVYAGTLSDYAPFATLNTNLAPVTNALWQAAKRVIVGGDFSVTGSNTTVIPDADPVTGLPVVFKVGGNFTLGADAKFDGRRCGWGWNTGTAPAGAKTNAGVADCAGWTFAPGGGRNYNIGGGYGGNAAVTQTSGAMKFGYAYGYEAAPFLPGSCSGWYLKKGPLVDLTRGGGSVVVFAASSAEINGKIDVSSSKQDLSGASGGGIWLGAQEFTFGEGALLDAHGSDIDGYAGSGLGGGGRIALAEGLTWDQFDALAGGTMPDGFKDYQTILPEEVATDVAGGIFTGSGTPSNTAKPGTLSFVKSSALPVQVRVSIFGDGSVTYKGSTYTEAFTINVPARTDFSLEASPAEGYNFYAWNGEIVQDGYCFTRQVTLSTELPAEISAIFVLAKSDTREWTGGGGDKNWSNPLNWSPAGFPDEDTAVLINNAQVVLTGSVAVSNLVVSGSSVFTVKAEAVEGESTSTNLYSNATVLRAKAISIEGTSKVIPSNDPITGAPVCFECDSFALAEGAVIDATGTGWAWYESAGDPYATLTQGAFQTRAMGAGGDTWSAGAYNRGGGYGSTGGNATAVFGRSYGYAYAPFLPGSPNGLYNFTINNQGLPGGTVWI